MTRIATAIFQKCFAAADGLFNLAGLLTYGPEGRFRCLSCDHGYQYIMFGDRIAVYADDNAFPPAHHSPAGENRALRDFKDHEPSRSDGFMVLAGDSEVLDLRAAALLSLARRAPSPEPALLLGHFLGRFPCGKCGAQGPIHPI
jgi:hypothetical protein